MTHVIIEQILYWKKSAKIDHKTANGLFQIKRYDGCLFYCHLMLEKILKGLTVQATKQPAPLIHNLEKLAYLGKIDLDDEKTKLLRQISAFNIAGRYQDVKFSFYKKANKEYTEKYLQETIKLFIWLEKKYQKH